MKRFITFVLVGGVCALIQLAILFVLLRSFVIESEYGEIAANSFSYMLSVQVNFLLSSNFTWRDRITSTHPIGLDSMKRWFAFNAMMLSGLVVNFIAFSTGIAIAPPMTAGVIALGVSAIYNFILSSKLVFRPTNMPRRAT